MEKRNADPEYFQRIIHQNFPRLNGRAFSVYRMGKDKPVLIPLENNVDSAVALCNYEDLNRSHIYVKPILIVSYHISVLNHWLVITYLC